MFQQRHLLAFACALALCLGLAACGNDTPQNQPQAAQQQETESQGPQSATGNGAGGETGAASIDPADLASIDTTIGFGDYEAMADLSANLSQAATSKTVVQVDGIVKNYGTSYSIVEESADGASRIGVVFVVDGGGAGDYPQDGQRARVTGIVTSDETGYTSFILTLPRFVEAL